MNWKIRIKEAKKRKKFTTLDTDKSSSFSTCAIGEKFKLSRKSSGWFYYMENKFGLRFTTRTQKLGMDFFKAIVEQNIPRAEKIYNKIQELKV